MAASPDASVDALLELFLRPFPLALGVGGRSMTSSTRSTVCSISTENLFEFGLTHAPSNWETTFPFNIWWRSTSHPAIFALVAGVVIGSVSPIRFIQKVCNCRCSHIIPLGRERFIGNEIQSGAFDQEILQSCG